VVLQAGGLSLSSRVMLSTFWGAKPYKFFDHTGYGVAGASEHDVKRTTGGPPFPSAWKRARRRPSASGVRGLLHGGVDLCLGIERTV
jgi:hypothetical protein